MKFLDDNLPRTWSNTPFLFNIFSRPPPVQFDKIKRFWVLTKFIKKIFGPSEWNQTIRPYFRQCLFKRAVIRIFK